MYVTIGNSAGGLAAAHELRKADGSGPVLMLSEEEHTGYSQPLISKHVSEGKGVWRMPLRPGDSCLDYAVELRLSPRTLSVAPSRYTAAPGICYHGVDCPQRLLRHAESQVEQLHVNKYETARPLSLMYGGPLLGRYATIVIARQGDAAKRTNRVRLRPPSCPTQSGEILLSSRQPATRRAYATAENTWISVGGEPVVARLGRVPAGGETWQGSEVFAGAH